MVVRKNDSPPRMGRAYPFAGKMLSWKLEKMLQKGWDRKNRKNRQSLIITTHCSLAQELPERKAFAAVLLAQGPVVMGTEGQSTEYSSYWWLVFFWILS